MALLCSYPPTPLQNADWFTYLFCMYTLSGSINHMMTLAMHELSHDLGFKARIHNRAFAFVANLPMGIPAAASFRRYHLEHHKFQGEDVLDVDVPTRIEGVVSWGLGGLWVWVWVRGEVW